MTSILRQIVAGPRSRHPEANLDLCYVTDQIIATSGPSGTYPQRAYRNPLDQLVAFLDSKHGDKWSIWEFRAEGTGYPDSEVRGKVAHYPWPDHHPPPFKLVPMIMAGMRNWLQGNGDEKEEDVKGRVVVVHCKAGKGRSGSMACSYLISECGWSPNEAMARFTERRMRPGFGQGVSIPSQVRWVGYVDRWTKHGKIYRERPVEILEVHVWGLREGVKVQVEGFVDEGKKMHIFHVFKRHERVIVEGGAPGGDGVVDMVSDMASTLQEDVRSPRALEEVQQDGNAPSQTSKRKETIIASKGREATGSEDGGSAIIFKPSEPVILKTSDVNIDFERRNKATMGWTMVTSVAHVWFNIFFEGRGPEQHGHPDNDGVFNIEWDKMDGIRGSSKKGTRAFDKLSVVWRAVGAPAGHAESENIILEPAQGKPVPQMEAANWQGETPASPNIGRGLGLRTESPSSVDNSKASSVKSVSPADDDQASVEGIKPSGPGGEDDIALPDPIIHATEPSLADPSLAEVKSGLDMATSTTPKKA